MKKILFLAPSLTNDAIARPFLLARLFRDEHQVTIAGPAQEGKPNLMEESGIRLQRLHHTNLLKQIAQAAKLARKYEVIVACDGILYASVAGAASRLLGSRFIFDTGDDHLAAKSYSLTEIKKRRWWIKIRLFKRDMSRRIAYALRHLANGRTVASSELKKRFGGFVTFIPVDTNFFQHGNGEAIKRKYGSPLILHLGTIKRYKGFEYLINAFPAIERTIPEAKLLVVGLLSGGLGGFAYNIKEQAEEMSKNIVFFDAVQDNEETRNFLAAADCIVITSEDNEIHNVQFPIKLGLAMAAKKPIVAWNVGVIPEVLGDGGIIVEPKVDQISKAITQVLKDKEHASQLAERSLEKAEARFSYNTLRKPLEEIYFGTHEISA